MAPSVVKEFVERSDFGITQQHASNHLVTPVWYTNDPPEAVVE